LSLIFKVRSTETKTASAEAVAQIQNQTSLSALALVGIYKYFHKAMIDFIEFLKPCQYPVYYFRTERLDNKIGPYFDPILFASTNIVTYRRL
jgi:hypothetical protein